MALLIWMPFTKNWRNIGSLQWNRGASPFDDDLISGGKIGSLCLGPNGSYTSEMTPNFISNLSTTNIYSICFWGKCIDTSIPSHWLIQLGSGSGTSRGLWESHKTNYRYWGFGGSGQNIATSINTVDGNWHHTCFTVNQGIVKLYIDGIYQNQITESATNPLGGNNQISIDPSGYNLNDLRIYDHCLSALEVKEISQGLVLHYKLNGQSGGVGENLISNSEIHTITANASNQYNYFWAVPTGTLTIGETYTFSAIAKITGTNAPTKCTVYNYHTNPNTGGPRSDNFIADGVTRDSFTFVANATGFICYAGNSGSTGGFGAEYKQLKLEKGSVATPWTPTSIEMGKDLTKVVDSSGYGNNGIAVNSPSNIADSKSRYNICTEFNGSNTYINAGTGAKVKDEITVAWWGYMDSWSSYTRAISCTEGGGWNFEVSSGKINFAMGTGTSSNTYKSCTSNTTLASLASGWHHFVGTYNGLESNLYIDGVLDKTLSCYTTKTPIYYHSSNSIIVGAEANAGNTAAGSYFNGKLSDIRIYATALSAEDILTLYNTPAHIDNLGSVHCFEVNEMETTNLSDFALTASNWVSDGVTATYSEDDMGPMVKIVPSSGSKRIYHNVTNIWKNEQSYIVSFIAKADANGAVLRASRSIANFAPNFNLTTSWKKYYGIITSSTTTDGGTLSIDCQTSTNYYIADIKLEEANKNLISILENGVVKENWIDENNFNNNAKFLKETSVIIGNNFIEK